MAKAKKTAAKKAKASKTVAPKTVKAKPKNQPLMPVKPPREKSKESPRARARRARIRAICARTRVAQAEIDAFIADADTSDVDHLPVMVVAERRGATPTRKTSWRNPRDPVVKTASAASTSPAPSPSS